MVLDKDSEQCVELGADASPGELERPGSVGFRLRAFDLECVHAADATLRERDEGGRGELDATEGDEASEMR